MLVTCQLRLTAEVRLGRFPTFCHSGERQRKWEWRWWSRWQTVSLCAFGVLLPFKALLRGIYFLIKSRFPSNTPWLTDPQDRFSLRAEGKWVSLKWPPRGWAIQSDEDGKQLSQKWSVLEKGVLWTSKCDTGHLVLFMEKYGPVNLGSSWTHSHKYFQYLQRLFLKGLTSSHRNKQEQRVFLFAVTAEHIEGLCCRS